MESMQTRFCPERHAGRLLEPVIRARILPPRALALSGYPYQVTKTLALECKMASLGERCIQSRESLSISKGEVLGMDDRREIKCFVVGPIGDELAEVGSPPRKLYEEAIAVWEEVILPSCNSLSIRPLRSDTISKSGEIVEVVPEIRTVC